MPKKKKCPEFENHERWLVAFADMMTLLFALFVVLYAIAIVNTSKVKQVTESMQTAFGIKEEIPKEEGTIPRGPTATEGIFRYIKGNTSREQILQKIIRERAAIISAQARNVEQKLSERLYGTKQFPDSAKKPVDRVIYVARDPEGIRITLLARILFKPGEYTLTPEAYKIIQSVAEVLKGIGRVIRVEGHTDNIPYERNGMSNWELSTLRATTVTKFLISTKLFPVGSVYPAGFAETRPLSENDSAENRALNRRVDLKILYDNPTDYIPPDEQLGNGEKSTKE
ncbi:OmpA/MotB family protein [Fluviispira sanaruensis]|uniref:Flagellar motor protein MotD n=1 Tax=Fluviispira sanaruensis TaxID=2493639 RepID=A0A4P2VJ10_FLUSA|nr:flagellar motor protein MotB [Fluviispira sanaruensis]BBH51884.1 flagellar motor protein MotD [Fluviispira sanaruensis]